MRDTSEPFVVVTGFPHSGTSYMANLVSSFGFNPGPKEHLKGANQMNRLGHWENLKIRKPIWDEALGGAPNPYVPDLYRDTHPPSYTTASEVWDYINDNGITLYKDTFWPLIRQYLPNPTRLVVMSRDEQATFESPIRYGLDHADGWDEFKRCYHLWWDRLKQLQESGQIKSALVVQYEGFPSDRAVTKVAEYLEVEVTPELLERSRTLWYPGNE